MDDQPAPGWYPDPNDPTSYRWWDGESWTDEVSSPLSRADADVGQAMAASSDTEVIGPADSPSERPEHGSQPRRRLGVVLGGALAAVVLVGGGVGVGLFLAARDAPVDEPLAVESPGTPEPTEEPVEARSSPDPESTPDSEPDPTSTPDRGSIATPPATGWTVVLESFEMDRYSVQQAAERAEHFRSVGISETDVLLSDDYASLNPGFWVVHAGHWDDEEPAAEYCRSIRDRAPSCYQRRLSDDPEAAASRDSGSSDQLEAAMETVRSRGFDPVDTGGYHDDLTLQVIVGSATGSATGRPRQAFFFVDHRYIGTDTLEPSASVGLSWQDDTTVALVYATYDPPDAMCCPSGSSTVRYYWDGTSLSPLDPIPTNDPNAYGSRR